MIYIEPIEGTASGNMFHHDLFSCGITLGKVRTGKLDRVIAITKSLDVDKECPFVILHNEATGERVAVCFSEESKEMVAKHYRLQQVVTSIRKDT